MFLIYVAVVGICMGSLKVHFFLLDDLGQQKNDCDDLKAIKFLQGLCIALQCTGELPVLQFSGRLIKYLRVELASNLVLLAYLTRFVWYGMYMTSPWQTIYVEPLHGICIGLFFPVLTSKAISIANDFRQKDRGKEATVMGLVYSAFELGTALGGWVCGYLYQEYGSAFTFQCMSYLITFILCLRILVNNLLKDE